MGFESLHTPDRGLESVARKKLLMGVLATSLAAFGSDAEGQTPSPERFSDIPRIELETSVDANSYEKFTAAIIEQRMHVQGIALSIENGIKNNTITSVEHINELQQQLVVFRENITNAQLMAAASANLEGMSNEEVIEDIGLLVYQINEILSAAEKLLTDLEIEMGEEV